MDNTVLKVDLLGTSLNIRSKESPEYLNQVIDTLKLRISQLKSELSVRDPLKLALIAALNLTDELIKLQNTHKNQASLSSAESSEINSITNTLIERINESLSDN